MKNVIIQRIMVFGGRVQCPLSLKTEIKVKERNRIYDCSFDFICSNLLLMLVFSKYRPYIALASAVIFIVSGMLSFENIFGAIDFNVLLMIAGTMGIVALFIESKMPELLADLLMEKVPNVKWAAIAMSLFAGLISAFIDNIPYVATMLPVIQGLVAGMGAPYNIEILLYFVVYFIV